MQLIHPKVALIGKSGAGKSKLATSLSQLGFTHIRTGAICRYIATLLFGNDEKRSTQQLDDALTQLDSSIFLRASLRGVKLDRPYVIDSLRFRSDLLIARELGCLVVRVVAAEETRLTRLAARGQSFVAETDGAHRSEIELDNEVVDVTIENATSEDWLHNEICQIVSGSK